MPWMKFGKDEPEKYVVPKGAMASTETEEMISALLRWRKETREDREKFLAAQKEAAKEKDYETARWWSTLAAERLKDYRAICLVLGHFDWGSFPGDCRRKDYKEWSKELAERCDTYFGRIMSL